MNDTTTVGGDTMVREETKTSDNSYLFNGGAGWTMVTIPAANLRIDYAPKPAKNVVAIIPARGNSKRIPRKNLKLLGGKPLLQYTLDAARNASVLSKAFISSEDEEIREWCQAYISNTGSGGLFGIIERPNYLSQDFIQNDEVTLHAYRMLYAHGYDPEILVLLQPTSPFRLGYDIDEAVYLFVSRRNTVIGVYKDTGFHWRGDNFIEPIGHNPEKRNGKQWIDKRDWLYSESGSIYVFDARRFSTERNVRMPPFIPYIMPEENSIDIDTELDWLIAEQLVGQLPNAIP